MGKGQKDPSARHAETVKALKTAHGNIKQKCNNSNDPQYVNYGKRKITLAPRWASNCKLFVEEVIAEIGLKPTPNHTLDRIDNNGNYEPDNLRWETKRKQAANRRTTCLINQDGEIIDRPTAAHHMGVKPNTLAKRIDRGSLADPRLRNFEANWNKSLAQKYGRYSTSLSDEQKRSLYKTIVRLPPEIDISLVANAAILFWPEFADVAEDECGLSDTFIPSTPQLGFLLKNIETAVDFWRRKRAERDRRKQLADQAKARDEWDYGDIAAEEQEPEREE
jgi:hypothetical protein